METDKNTVYGTGRQRNARANVCSTPAQQHRTQINGVERERNGSFFINATAGADPGFQKGGGTPKERGENSKTNDIHDPLN